MKIGIILRKFSLHNPRFCMDLIEYITSQKSQNTFHIYASSKLPITDKKVTFSNGGWFLEENTSFYAKLKKDSLDVIINFDESIPIFYKKKTLQIITSLEHILYPDISKHSFFQKNLQSFIFKNTLWKSYQILSFSKSTKNELNEKLNIPENKIQIVPPFFPSSILSPTQINIKNILTIAWEYFIYDYNYQSNTNLKRLLEVLKDINKEIDISLVILWNQNANNREVREDILRWWLEKKVFFAWNPESKDLPSYYTQSRWVIYPIVYNTFPLTLANALHYQVPIFASDTSEMKHVFWDKISYFSPTSSNSIKTTLLNSLRWETQTIDYHDIIEKYSIKNYWDTLLSYIK